MFKFLRYLFIIGMIVFSFNVSFTWDIPIDNQMGVFCLGLFMVFIFFYHVVIDIRYLMRKES